MLLPGTVAEGMGKGMLMFIGIGWCGDGNAPAWCGMESIVLMLGSDIGVLPTGLPRYGSAGCVVAVMEGYEAYWLVGMEPAEWEW